MSSYLTGLLVILSINVIVAYGAYLPIVAGQLNLGVAGFMAIGAYGSAFFSNRYGLPPLLTVFIGAGVAGLVALVVAAPVLRTRGIYLALATFAFGQIVSATLLNIEAVGAAEGYSVFEHFGIEVIGPFAIGTIAVVAALGRLRYGLNVTAVHDDETVADLFGVNTRAYQTAAFTLGAIVAGLGGALYGHYYSYIRPQEFNVLLSIYIVLYVLLGGTRTVAGPIVGAAIFTLLPELFRDLDRKLASIFGELPGWLADANAWRYAIFAVFIIVLMTVRPQGLITRGAVRWSVEGIRLLLARLGPRREASSP